jgi:glycosyltransferase involved in cell wall biosynthesis
MKQDKPKICYFRGSYLNPFEAQYLVPLQKQFDITAVHSGFQRYDLSEITIPLHRLKCLDYLNGIIPRQMFGHLIPNIFKHLGYEEMFFGIDPFISKFDLIHLPEQTFYFTWQVAKRKKVHGYKILTMQDEINPFWYVRNSAIAERAKLVRQETDLFIARSHRAKNALMIEGVAPEKIHVIGHGIDTSLFHPGPRDENLCRQLKIETDRFIILFVGRLVWTKGIFALADAAKLLMQNEQIKKINPLFLIVGDGEENSAFQSRLRQLEVTSSFKLVGDLPYHLLPDIHRLADIFILPSISTRYILEQFGIVLIESMATGKPVISTYCGAIDEVVGDAGILVQPNDYFRLYKALLKLCVDKSLRDSLGESALCRAQKYFSNNIISSSIASAYRKVLG